MKVLVACEESQAVTIELRRLGHEAYSCDIIDCSGGHPEWHIQADVLPLLNGFCEFNMCQLEPEEKTEVNTVLQNVAKMLKIEQKLFPVLPALWLNSGRKKKSLPLRTQEREKNNQKEYFMFSILGIIGGLSLVGTLGKGLWESVETDAQKRSYGWTKREGCWFDKKGFIVDFVSNPKSPIYEEECQRLREHEATLTTLYERMRDSYERI